MKRKNFVFSAGLLAAMLGILLSLVQVAAGFQAVSAAAVLQLTEFPTPTPGPDGRILYVVQAGDTLWRIAAISGISVDELRRINNLAADDVIREGQAILLGFGGPSEPAVTPVGPEATFGPDLATATPLSGPGIGIICILLYDDVNGDAVRQEEEVPVPGGALSLASRTGTTSRTADTLPAGHPDTDVDTGSVCFPDLIAGAYNVTVAIPDGYNPTTGLNIEVDLRGGDITYIDFGAQLSSAGVLEAAPPAAEGGTSPVLGIIGLGLLVGGVGLALYAILMSRGGIRAAGG